MRKKIFPTVLLFMLTSCGVAGSNELDALNTENEAAMAAYEAEKAEYESTLSLGNKKIEVKCGDVTGNGVFDFVDRWLIGYYSSKQYKFKAGAVARGDVNFDGKLTKEDADDMRKALRGEIKSLQCPALAKVYDTSSFKCGDLTDNGDASSLDASRINRIVSGLDELTADALAIGDVDFDGRLSDRDAEIVQEYKVGLRKSLACPAAINFTNHSTSSEETKRVCGDLTGNGSLASLDGARISQIEAGYKELTADALAVGDVNFDGKLTKEDGDLVQNAVVGKIKSLQCPARAAVYDTSSFKCGDLTGNGDVNSADASEIMKIVSGLNALTADALARGDVDFDGRLSDRDAKIVQEYRVGLRKSLACPAALKK